MLQTTAQGLTSEEARQRLDRYGPNLVRPKMALYILGAELVKRAFYRYARF